jgi:hypothetical protein
MIIDGLNSIGYQFMLLHTVSHLQDFFSLLALHIYYFLLYFAHLGHFHGLVGAVCQLHH